MPVLTVYRGDDPDTAAGLARGIQATGVRAIAAHWFGQHVVYRFNEMSEADIDSWMDQEWERLKDPDKKNGPAELQLDEAPAPTKGTEMNTTIVAPTRDLPTAHDPLVRDWCEQASAVLRTAWEELSTLDEFMTWAAEEIRTGVIADSGTKVQGISLDDCKRFWLARHLPNLPTFPISRPWTANVEYFFHNLDEMQVYLKSDVIEVDGLEVAHIEEALSVDPSRGHIETWFGPYIEVLVGGDDIRDLPTSSVVLIGRAITRVSEQLLEAS